MRPYHLTFISILFIIIISFLSCDYSSQEPLTSLNSPIGGSGGVSGNGGTGGTSGTGGNTALNDRDGDGFPNESDPCPDIKNAQGSGLDVNNDGIPDECTDTDGDRIADGIDNCPFVANADQRDSNRNGVGDVCANNDTDRDGVRDDVDACPYNGNVTTLPSQFGMITFTQCPYRLSENAFVTPENDLDRNGVPDAKFVVIEFLISF